MSLVSYDKHNCLLPEVNSKENIKCTLQVKVVRIHDGPQLEEVAEASAGSESVSSLTWLSQDALIVGSSGSSELQFWRLDPNSGLYTSHVSLKGVQLLLPLTYDRPSRKVFELQSRALKV